MTPYHRPRAKAVAARKTAQPRLAWFAALMFVTILGLALANMASAQQKILIRGNGAEPNSLDPHSATGTWENNIIGDLFMGLYTEDAAAKPILGAADSVKTAPDGLSWTFTIRPHTWSDGVPVTANDFVFAFQRILNPANAREYAQVLFPIKGARAVNTGKIPPAQLGVKAIDAKTLVIELEKPAPYLPELLTHYTTYPIPKHAYDKHGDKWSRAGNMVTNGPFMLKEWRQNDRVIAAKNPKFYDAANVKLDGVVYFPTQDDPAAFRRFQAGELDMHERWPIAELARIRANPTLKSEARSYTYLAVFYTVFNMTRKPFDDVRIRKALAMSIDRKTMLEKVFQGALGVPAVSFFPPGMANADMSHKVFFADMPFEQRRAEARKLMEAAGYGPNKRLKLTFNIGNTADAKRQAVFVQSMWQEIYVDAEIMSQDTAVHYKTLQTKNYDVGQAGWVWDYNDAKNILFLFESTTKAQNYPGYNNPEYDALMIASDNEKDPVKRGEILGKMNALLLRDLPATPNIHQFERKLVKSYVKGFVENARVINRARYLDLGPEAATISARAGSLK